MNIQYPCISYICHNMITNEYVIYVIYAVMWLQMNMYYLCIIYVWCDMIAWICNILAYNIYYNTIASEYAYLLISYAYHDTITNKYPMKKYMY